MCVSRGGLSKGKGVVLYSTYSTAGVFMMFAFLVWLLCYFASLYLMFSACGAIANIAVLINLSKELTLWCKHMDLLHYMPPK